MEPTFHVGDLLVFEYHRTPRQDHQVVIANLADLGSDAPGIEAIKRVSQTAEEWVFRSDNPDFQPIRRAKSELAHPIVGTLVSRLCHGA
jgi:phage repressor protein C with HTH and peptisase S24 domain